MHWKQYSSYHLSVNLALSGNQPATSWTVPSKLSVTSEANTSPENWGHKEGQSETAPACLAIFCLLSQGCPAQWYNFSGPSLSTYCHELSPELVHSDQEVLGTWLLWSCCNKVPQTVWLKRQKDIGSLIYCTEKEKFQTSMSAKLVPSGATRKNQFPICF